MPGIRRLTPLSTQIRSVLLRVEGLPWERGELRCRLTESLICKKQTT